MSEDFGEEDGVTLNLSKVPSISVRCRNAVSRVVSGSNTCER